MKVLVAVDGTQSSQLAIERLGASVWWGDTEFSIVNVAAIPTVRQWEVWGMDVDWNLREKLLAESQKIIDGHVDYLQKHLTKGLKIEGKVLESTETVADAIVAEAVSSEADLIVIGSRSHSGFDRIVFGSVAENVLSKAPCSVEIVKSQDRATDTEATTAEDSSTHSTTVRAGKLNENNHAHGLL